MCGLGALQCAFSIFGSQPSFGAQWHESERVHHLLSACSACPRSPSQAAAKEREGRLVEVDLKKLEVRRLRTVLGGQVLGWEEGVAGAGPACAMDGMPVHSMRNIIAVASYR